MSDTPADVNPLRLQMLTVAGSRCGCSDWLCSRCDQMIKIAEAKVQELERENAELKADNSHLQDRLESLG